MKTNNKNTYVKVKDEHDAEYLCPVHSIKNSGTVSVDELDECVETDVVGRYAGNIETEST